MDLVRGRDIFMLQLPEEHELFDGVVIDHRLDTCVILHFLEGNLNRATVVLKRLARVALLAYHTEHLVLLLQILLLGNGSKHCRVASFANLLIDDELLLRGKGVLKGRFTMVDHLHVRPFLQLLHLPLVQFGKLLLLCFRELFRHYQII